MIATKTISICLFAALLLAAPFSVVRCQESSSGLSRIASNVINGVSNAIRNPMGALAPTSNNSQSLQLPQLPYQMPQFSTYPFQQMMWAYPMVPQMPMFPQYGPPPPPGPHHHGPHLPPHLRDQMAAGFGFGLPQQFPGFQMIPMMNQYMPTPFQNIMPAVSQPIQEILEGGRSQLLTRPQELIQLLLREPGQYSQQLQSIASQFSQLYPNPPTGQQQTQQQMTTLSQLLMQIPSAYLQQLANMLERSASAIRPN